MVINYSPITIHHLPLYQQFGLQASYFCGLSGSVLILHNSQNYYWKPCKLPKKMIDRMVFDLV